MRPLLSRLLAGSLVCLSTAAMADPVGYAVGFDHLYRIDMGTGQATVVGPLGFIDVEGLAFSPSGVLYGVADAGHVPPDNGQTDFLLQIDTDTGAATAVGQLTGLAGTGAGVFGELDYGLAFTCDGRLWASSDTTRALWQIDPTTGGTHYVGDTGATISGLAGRGNQLYGVSVVDNESLYRIDTATGRATLIGLLTLVSSKVSASPMQPRTSQAIAAPPFGLIAHIFDAGLDFSADGELWVTLDYLTPPQGIPPLRNDVARLDPTSGEILSFRVITGAGTGIDTVQMEGLALAPPGACGGTEGPESVEVPGPGAFLLGLLALVLFLSSRKALPTSA